MKLNYSLSLPLVILWVDMMQVYIYHTIIEFSYYQKFDKISSSYSLTYCFLGYYGYLLAETYAANMFYKMFKYGSVLDQTAGMRYRCFNYHYFILFIKIMSE